MKPVHLTAEQIDFYHAEGYLTLPRITTPVDLASIREIYDRLFAEQTGRDDGNQFDLAGADEDGAVARLPQILDPARYAPELNDLVFKRSAKELATQLLGGECSGEDHLILKPAGYGAPTPWHQDEAYWSPELVYDSLSIWMPLQDATVESGCMQFVPRSHRRGIVAHRPIGGDPRVHGLEVEEFDGNNVVACPVPAGGVTIHHCRTLHYAAPNTTPEPRRAYIQKFERPTSPREQPLDFHWKRTQQTARAKRAQQSEQA